MDFKKYVTKEHIEKVAKDSEFPNMDFIELLIHDYRVFCELLKLKKDFVLKGGAAAQIYMPLKEQRASIDIDLVTDVSTKETKELMEKLGAKEHTPKKAIKDLPLSTYLIDIKSAIDEKRPRQVKVDILHENLSNYKINKIKDIELFILKLNFELPIIAKGSLIADKLLTLAKKSVGIRDKKKLKEVPKHIYDLIKLCKELTLEDLDSILFSFDKVANNELKYRKLKFSIEEVINHINETLKELCCIDVKTNDIKNNINRFTSAYLNKPSRLTLEEWIVGGLKLRILLNQIKNYIVDKKSAKDIYSELKNVNDNLKKINDMKIEEKRTYREKLTEEVRDKLDNWKHIKTRTEQRMFLGLELVEDDTSGLFKRFIFRVLNREKFEKITNLIQKNRDALREALRRYFEKKIKFNQLVMEIKKACPQKTSYLCKFIATTEICKIESLARLEELKSRKEKYCYVELSKNSIMCSDCRRLIDGKVFKIETLEKNTYANYGKKSTLWKPTVPLHPNCNHKIRALTPSEKKKVKNVPENGLKIELK